MTPSDVSGCRLYWRWISASLRSLNLACGDQVTDVGVQRVLAPGVRISPVSTCTLDQVSDVGVQAIGIRCLILISLNLYYCEQVSDVGCRLSVPGEQV